jgi:hypothetical protein
LCKMYKHNDTEKTDKSHMIGFMWSFTLALNVLA